MLHPPVWVSEPLEDDLYIAGLPRFHVEVTTASLGGQLYALLEDCDKQSNCIHLGHAIMICATTLAGMKSKRGHPWSSPSTPKWNSLRWMRRLRPATSSGSRFGRHGRRLLAGEHVIGRFRTGRCFNNPAVGHLQPRHENVLYAPRVHPRALPSDGVMGSRGVIRLPCRKHQSGEHHYAGKHENAVLYAQSGVFHDITGYAG